MGKIETQAIKSTFFSYAGIILGFISVGYLFPLVLSKSELGGIRLISQYAEIAAKVVALGSSTLIVRYYSKFKNTENAHNGLLFWLLIINLFGFILFLISYTFFGDSLISRNAEKSPIFSQYFFWIIPITLGIAIYNLFDGYLTALKMSTFGFLVKDFIQRLAIVGLLLVSFFISLSFHTFSITYFLILLISPLLMVAYTYAKKELKLKPKTALFTTPLIKEMTSVSGFALLTGLGGTIMVFIDSIMLNELIDEASVAVYTTMVYYAILITVPARGITKIGSAVIAEALNNNDLHKVKSIYFKSCLTQFIPGAFVFIMLCVNLDFIFYLLPASYQEGYWLIYIIGIGNLFNVMTGINTQIIAYSPLHKFNSIFVLGLIIVAIITNLYFIPLYGISGAAMATSLSLFVFNFAKYLLLLIKYKFQPFNLKYLTVILFTAISILVTELTSTGHLIIDTAINSILAAAIFIFPILRLKISPDINNLIYKKTGIRF